MPAGSRGQVAAGRALWCCSPSSTAPGWRALASTTSSAAFRLLTPWWAASSPRLTASWPRRWSGSGT
eukprot:3513114-Lingulodinium_polyedra.AAC.1